MTHDLQEKVIVVTYPPAFGSNGLVFRSANQMRVYLVIAAQTISYPHQPSSHGPSNKVQTDQSHVRGEKQL